MLRLDLPRMISDLVHGASAPLGSLANAGLCHTARTAATFLDQITARSADTAIPADLLVAAVAVEDKILAGDITSDEFDTTAIIGRAILAERQRCMRIAEGYATSPMHSEVENFCAGNIADAIERGDQP